jgi:asparagine N-glycosylation enzyme membrane subunit Stt3
LHSTWYIFFSTWSLVLVAYLVLYLVTAKRLRGHTKKRSDSIFLVIAVLAAIRISLRFALGRGLIYRFAVVFVGIAAGLAALDLARMLLTQKPDDGTVDSNRSEERIQSLKLN